MKPSPSRSRLGFSLVELIVAMGVMVVAVAMAGSLLVTIMSLTRNATSLGDAQDAARLSGEILAGPAQGIRTAGLLTPYGINIANGSGVTTIFPVFGMDGTTGLGNGATGSAAPNGHYSYNGSDDFWVIVPSYSAMRLTCGQAGSGDQLATGPDAGLGTKLQVNCQSGKVTFATTNFLMVSNDLTGALLSPGAGLTFGAGGAGGLQIDYQERANGVAIGDVLSAAQGTHAGFSQGDWVFAVTPLHYKVQKKAGSLNPGLYSHVGVVGIDAYNAQELTEDSSATDVLVQSNVEDLQVAYEFDPGPGLPAPAWNQSFGPPTGNPNSYLSSPYLAPEISNSENTAPTAANLTNPGGVTAVLNNLRAIRLSVVALSTQVETDSRGRPLLVSALAPIPVENHNPTPTPDGFRRTLYSQRIELLNMAPGNL